MTGRARTARAPLPRARMPHLVIGCAALVSAISTTAATAASAATAGEWIESRLAFTGELRGYECPDVNGDGRGDLLVITHEASATGAGDRMLSLHLQREGSFRAEPDWRLTVPGDVTAYALPPRLDLRDEPGAELLLFTARGVYSVSTTVAGLRDNLRRELDLPLFPDLADGNALPRWSMLADLDGADGSNELLVWTGSAAQRRDAGGALVAFGLAQPAPEPPAVDAVDAGAAPRLVERARVPVASEPRQRGGARVSSRMRQIGGLLEIEFDDSLAALFPHAASSMPRFSGMHFLSRSAEIDAPLLVDADGDERLDAVVPSGRGGVRVALQRADGTFAPFVAKALPGRGDASGEGGGGGRPDLRAADVDGDGRAELIALHEEGEGLARDHVLLVVRFGADGLPLDEPAARVKLEGTDVRYTLRDVDGDRRLDVVARVIELPSGITSLAAVRVDLSLLVFRGQEGAGLSRRPDLRFDRSLQPEQLARVRESFLLDVPGDFDGDGLDDLMVIQPDGLLRILPLARDGDALRVAEPPLSSHRPADPIRDARVEALSADGVADLVLRHERALTLFVSTRGGGGK